MAASLKNINFTFSNFAAEKNGPRKVISAVEKSKIVTVHKEEY